MAKKSLGKIKGLSVYFLPYSEIKDLDSSERIKKILNIVLGNSILVLQGRLAPEEETRLIEDTMAMIGHVKNFKGIELAVISGSESDGFFDRLKRNLLSAIAGSDLTSITIIGAASIVKEIKKNPKKIELFLKGF
ncbi:MAG: hypothetical protein KatS3mg001_502 [Candidatus Pacearchaeota archaeon]|nr:MAG: hypothetical protein KatS3mg001_502 [Candidatus Pacearchaeota archaeon]